MLHILVWQQLLPAIMASEVYVSQVKPMKTIIAAAIMLCSVHAVAKEPISYEDIPLERYEYSMDLDIDRVIQIATAPNVCQTVPVQMVYEDHQGNTHRLEYLTMGSGCNRH